MEMLFQLQLPLMIFLQGIETYLLDILSEIITFFGEIPIPLLVTVFIYWCLDKKKGFMIIISLMSAMMSTQVIKAIARVPRPFMEYPELVHGKRQSTATGFSFPSGHSTTSAAFYGSLAYNFKSKTIRAICILLIVLVPMSRLYLGVHWPLDIITGAIIGLIASMALARVFSMIYEHNKAFLCFCSIFASITLIIALALGIMLDVVRRDFSTLAEFKATSLYRATHDLMQNSAIATGLFFGMIVDRRFLSFKPATGARNRVLAMLIGLATASVVALALLSLPFGKYTLEFVAYAFIGLWATFVFPLISTKLGLMGKA